MFFDGERGRNGVYGSIREKTRTGNLESGRTDGNRSRRAGFPLTGQNVKFTRGGGGAIMGLYFRAEHFRAEHFRAEQYGGGVVCLPLSAHRP